MSTPDWFSNVREWAVSNKGGRVVRWDVWDGKTQVGVDACLPIDADLLYARKKASICLLSAMQEAGIDPANLRKLPDMSHANE